jgi:hypothetical protein
MSCRGAAGGHEHASYGGAAMMAMAALVTLVLLVALSLAMVVLVAHHESSGAVPVRATSRRRHGHGGPRPHA